MVALSRLLKERGLKKIILLAAFVVSLVALRGYCQDSQQLIEKVSKILNKDGTSGSSLIGGFSTAGLFGGIIFGIIGFSAFIYGKKTARFSPMIIGILLMAYPYFAKGTLVLYLIGAALSTSLFIFKE